jgi:hypothetical protein
MPESDRHDSSARELDPFVGDKRYEHRDRMWKEWELCRAGGGSRMVVLDGQPGIGKTRLVQEFYALLAADQPEPKYWPLRLVSQSHGLDGRWIIEPQERRPYARRARQTFWWKGFGGNTIDGRPARPMVGAEAAFQEQNAPLAFWNELWRRVGRLAWRILAAVGGLLLFVLGLAHVVGAESLGATVIGGLVALWAVWAERESVRRLLDEEVSGFLRWLRPASIVPGEWAAELSAKDRAWLEDELLELTVKRKIPGVVVVDDANWADDDTVELVRAMLRRSPRTLVIATKRPQPRSKAFDALGDEFTDKTTPISIEALTDEDVINYLRLREPRTDAAVAQALATHVEGNPFLLVGALDELGPKLVDRDHPLSPDEIRELPRDYDAVFEKCWDRLPREIRELMAVATLHGGQRVQPDCLSSGYREVFERDPGELIRTARDPHKWIVLVDRFLDRFADVGYRAVTEKRMLPAVITQADLRRARLKMIEYIVSRRKQPSEWAKLSDEARRVLLQMHVTAASERLVEPDEDAARAALDLAELTDRPYEAAASAAFAEKTLSWGNADPQLVDQARTVAAEKYGMAADWVAAERVLGEQQEWRSITFGFSPQTLKTRVRRAQAFRQAGFVAGAPARVGPGLEPVDLRPARVDEAIATVKELISDCEGQLPVDDELTLLSRAELVLALRQSSRFRDAISQCERLIADREGRGTLLDDHALFLRAQLAGALADSGDYPQALTRLQQLVADCDLTFAPDDERTLTPRVDLAALQFNRGTLDKPVDRFRELSEICTSVLPASHETTFKCRAMLGIALRSAGREDEAVAWFETLSRDCRRILGPRNPVTTSIEILKQEMAMEPLERLIAAALSGVEPLASVIEQFSKTDVYAFGLPAGDTSVPDRGTESDLVHSADEHGREELKVFTGFRFLRVALQHDVDLQQMLVLRVNGGELYENVADNVTIVINPWSDLEFRIPPRDMR